MVSRLITPGARSWLALALLLALAGLPAARTPGGVAPPPAWPAGLRLGQSPEEVTRRLGAPARTSRQVVAYRSVEQWHYGPPHLLVVTFTAFRGQGPRLDGVRARPRDAGGP